MITLRDYQKNIINECARQMRSGIRSILVQSPTGSGKTCLTAYMLKSAAEKGMPSLFICHRRELIGQSTRTFSTVGVNHGIIANGFVGDPRQLVQIAGIQTLTHRVNKIKKPRLIIWDETHHIAAAGWSKIHAMFPEAFHIGLTATPERLDGTGLGKWFSTIINGPRVRWLIENGFLADYKMYAPSSINTAGLHTSMGDFVKSELGAVVDKPSITGDAIKHYRKLADGKRAVVFCVSIEHSKHVVDQFNAAGIPAAHVDGETKTEDRDAAIKDFVSGKTVVLSNVDLFGEGFDLPSLEVSILLRPTQSLGLYLQQCGRSLRPAPGKRHAIILDHAGNCARHGMPCEEREWSLEGESRKNKKDKQPSVKICPKCFAAQFSGLKKCKICGYDYPVESRKIDHKDGELTEVDPNRIRIMRLREQGSANDFQALVDLGRKRGYRRPELWAKYIWNARQAKILSGA